MQNVRRALLKIVSNDGAGPFCNTDTVRKNITSKKERTMQNYLKKMEKLTKRLDHSVPDPDLS